MRRIVRAANAHHGLISRSQATALGMSRLADAGFITLRCTWEHIVRQPARTAQRVGAALRRSAPDSWHVA
jgi:hypothetical protein